MGKLSMDIPHSVGRDEVVRRVNGELDKLRASMPDMQTKWIDNVLDFSGTAMGFRLAGTLAVEDALMHLEVELPMAALMFRGMIEQRIRTEARALLE